MTRPTFTFYKIPEPFLVGDEENVSKTRENLTKFINKCYDIPRYKYNIITSSRVQNPKTLAKEIGLNRESALYVLVADSGPLTSVKGVNISSIECIECDEEFEYTEEMVTRTVGTIGDKKIEENVSELSAYTSNVPNGGRLLFDLLLRQVDPKMVTIEAVIIIEHELTGFYDKLGFVTVDKKKVELGKGNVRSMDSDASATKEFTLGIMRYIPPK